MKTKRIIKVDQRTDLKPADRGRQAYRDGLPLEANPYDVDSDDAFAWQDGWDRAEAEALGDEQARSERML